MNDPKAGKEPQISPDTLAQTGDETGIELNEKQLNNVSGGVISKIGDIKGESIDIGHK